MKKYLSFILIMGVVIGLAARPAAAEDKAQDALVIKARAIAGAEFVGETERSSKFYEYRDVPQGFIFDVFDLRLSKGSRYLTLSAEKIRQRDGRYTVSLGDYGKYKAAFTWDQIPHRYSFFAQTLYVESPVPVGQGVYAGPGAFYYGLPDPLQSAIQNAGSFAAAQRLWSQYLTGVHGVDLGLQRNKGTLNLEYTPSVPLTLSLDASRETRKGTRAMGASFGFNHAVEVPEPIDFVTSELKGKVEYSKAWTTLQAGYDLSVFDNEDKALIWDNPYRLADRTYSVPFGAYVNGDGSSRGQMALEPSNNAQNFFLNGVLKIMKYTRLTGSFSYGIFSQNDRLLPYTINTALANPAVGDPSALQAPRETARAKAHIVSFDLRLNSRVFKTDALSAYLNAGYRSYDFANKTEALDMPGQARVDQVWESAAAMGEAYAIEPYSFLNSKAFADLSLNLVGSTSLKFGYSRSWIERQMGVQVEGEPENKSHEDTFKVSADTNPVDWFLVRVSYLNSTRRRAMDGTDPIYPTFNFKRYYDANRDRSAVDILLGFSVIKNLDLELSYMRGADTYPTADYGLKDDNFDSYSADLTYALGKTTSIYGFYTYELYKANQASRQSNADGSFSSNPANDWTAMLKDKVDTIGGGFNTVLVKNKLNFDVSYSYSNVKGTSSLYSPPGGTPNLAVDFTKGLDTTQLQILKAQLLWKLAPKLSVAFGYWYELYNISDIARNDYKVDYVLIGGTYLGALEPGYKYHVGSVRFIYSW
jgi:MtrB/PioB family decaheme-associated outer membrane protein